ncbi:MAG: polysaccharide deacetylase family protein [Thaumarchaeota archaeon]|nr:polysaccharide deacetylase family protein [Nitrososphaerota archaeon]
MDELALHVKRTAKSVALQSARMSASIGAGFVSRRLLLPIKVAYDPPSPGTLYPGKKKAAACISIDFDVTAEDRFEANREGTRALLDLSEKYGVPMTWAICGMTADADRESYERILKSPVKQEIGIHTYSHIDAQRSAAEEFEKDVRRCVDALGLDAMPLTFVFPWNRVNHLPVLRRMGFKAFRGKERAIGAPALNEGLYDIRPVYYVDQKSQGAHSLIKRYVDLCASASSVFHLWTHPWSVVRGEGGGPMVETLDPVFRHLRGLADKGTLSLSTMGGLAEHFGSAREQPSGIRD